MIAKNTISAKRRIRFDVSRRGIDAGNQRRPVRREYENKQRTEQRQVRRWRDTHGVANLIFDAPTMTSSTVWLRDGATVSERVARKPPSARAAMRPQVTTTGSVIGNRSDCEQCLRGKGRSDHGYTPNRTTAIRAARDASGGDKQWQGTEMTSDDGKHAGNECEANERSDQCQREGLTDRKPRTFHRSVRKYNEPISAPTVSHAPTLRTSRIS